MGKLAGYYRINAVINYHRQLFYLVLTLFFIIILKVRTNHGSREGWDVDQHWLGKGFNQ